MNEEQIAQTSHTEEVILEENQQQSNWAEKVSRKIVLLIIAFIPLFFVAPTVLSIPFAKALILFVGTALASVFYVISVFKKGTLNIHLNYLYVAVVALLLIQFLSTVFGDMPRMSFFGYGFEVATFAGIFTLFVLSFLVSSLFRERDQLFSAFLAFLCGFGLVALFEIVRTIFGVNILLFDSFASRTANPVGSWNSLGAFFGIGVLFSFVTIESLSLSRVLKIFLVALLFISLGFLIIINPENVWMVLGIFSLLYLLYTYIFGRIMSADTTREESVETDEFVVERTTSEHIEYSRPKKISYYALSVFILSLLFIVEGGLIADGIANYFGVNNVEARPSWVGTLNIASETLSNSPLFGSGPNTFREEWLKYKSIGVNNTIFWNNGFDYGSGFLPTFIVTTGIAGASAWIIFLVLFVYYGATRIFRESRVYASGTDISSASVRRYAVIVTFTISLYLWILHFVLVPGVAVTTLTFIFTGLFASTAFNDGNSRVVNIDFRKFSPASFATAIFVVVFALVSTAVAYHTSINAYASSYVRQATAALSEGDDEEARDSVLKAVETAPNDIYYRELANLYINKARSIVSDDSISREEAAERFSEQFALARQAAESARLWNPLGYENHLVLGEVYTRATIVTGSENAYDNAVTAYEEATLLNPLNPMVDLRLAELEVAKNELGVAKDHIVEALKKKGDYTDAIFLLAQIQISQGNTGRAIESLEYAVGVAPANARLYFQLGVLRYSDKRYEGARDAFLQALEVSSKYANAKYFLGLSYDKLGRRAEAISVFEELSENYPDNSEVRVILENLQADRPPLAGVVDDDPSERESLPIEEEGSELEPDEADENEDEDESEEEEEV